MNAAQVRKLRELQDNLLSCMSTSPSSAGDVFPPLPLQCQSRSKKPTEETPVKILHSDSSSSPPFETSFDPAQDGVLNPSPLLQDSPKTHSVAQTVNRHEDPPLASRDQSKVISDSRLMNKIERHKEDSLLLPLLGERLVDVITPPPPLPSHADLSTAGRVARPSDEPQRDQEPSKIQILDSVRYELDEFYDDRAFPNDNDVIQNDVPTLDIITDDDVLNLDGEALNTILTTGVSIDERDLSSDALTPDFGLPVATGESSNVNGIVVESIRKDSNKVRHIIYKDHLRQPPLPPPTMMMSREDLIDGSIPRFDKSFNDGPEEELDFINISVDDEQSSSKEERLSVSESKDSWEPRKESPEDEFEMKDSHLFSSEFDTIPFELNEETVLDAQIEDEPENCIIESDHFSEVLEDVSSSLPVEDEANLPHGLKRVTYDPLVTSKRKYCKPLTRDSHPGLSDIDDQGENSISEGELRLESGETSPRYVLPTAGFDTNYLPLDPVELKLSQV